MRGLLSLFQSIHSSWLVPSASQDGSFDSFNITCTYVGVIRRYAPAFSTTTYSRSIVCTCFVGRPYTFVSNEFVTSGRANSSMFSTLCPHSKEFINCEYLFLQFDWPTDVPA